MLHNSGSPLACTADPSPTHLGNQLILQCEVHFVELGRVHCEVWDGDPELAVVVELGGTADHGVAAVGQSVFDQLDVVEALESLAREGVISRVVSWEV